MRVVVIGGGVIGLSVGLALARRGQQVTIIDNGTPGSGASAANAGWVTPSLAGPLPAPGLLGTSLGWLLRPDSPLWIRPRLDPALAAWLFGFWRHMNARDYRAGLEASLAFGRDTMSLFDELASEVRFEMHSDGLLLAYTSMRDYEEGLAEAGTLTPYGYGPVESATGPQVRDLEPALGDAIIAAFVIREERHVDPLRLTAGLIDALRRREAEFLAPVEVRGFDVRGGTASDIRTSRGPIPADAVVIAAGVGSRRLASWLGARIPIESGKGYAVDLSPPPLTLRRPVYLHGTRVAVSPLSDRLRLAGTMEVGGIGESISRTRVRAIEENVGRLLPGVANATGSTKRYLAGMRPLTPDGLPVVGPLPGVENVWIASGHGMMGVTLAPATAAAVAEGIVSGRVPSIVEPFRPDRFGRSARTA